MQTCNNCHQLICFEGIDCPLCEIQDANVELDEKIEELIELTSSIISAADLEERGGKECK